jgi:hypothetical protein
MEGLVCLCFSIPPAAGRNIEKHKQRRGIRPYSCRAIMDSTSIVVRAVMIGVIITSFFMYCTRIGEAANPGPVLRIMTANVPGLRNHISNVVPKAWDIAVFQECGMSLKNIGQIQGRCNEQGVKLLHGPLGPSAVGGVACLAKTNKVKEWRKGEESFVKNNRWQAIEIYVSKNSKVLLVNVYGHSGANDKEEIKALNETLLSEVFMMCKTHHVWGSCVYSWGFEHGVGRLFCAH